MILLLKIAKQNGGRKIARKLRDWYPGAIYHIMSIWGQTVRPGKGI